MIKSRIAREKAHSILRMYGINEAPINIDDICSQLGFKIAFVELSDKASAAIKIDGEKKAIIVNSKHSKNRQRFSMAHELGHYLGGHEDFDDEQRTHIDPSKKYLNPQYRQEEEADEFAAELLMPDFLLKVDVIENKLTLSELATKYKVSEQAMTIQLVNLELPFNHKNL